MRVLLLAGGLELDDETVYTLALGRALVGRGHQVLLLCGPGPLHPLLREDALFGVEHRFTGGSVRDLFELHRATQTAAAFRPDVLHVTRESLDATGFRLARRLGVPRVLTFHGRDARPLFRWRPADAILVPAQGQRATVVKAAPLDHARVRVVPYGLPDGPAPPRASVTGRRPAVGTVGPLRRGRGLKQFVATAARVARGSEALFFVIGTGPYHRFLARHAEQSGLGAQCVVTDVCAEPRALLSALDVVVFPSLDEEFGCLALLTLALRRPVVASAVGQAFDLIEDGVTGWLVPPGDTTALADRVLHALAHPDEAALMGARASERAGARHPLEAMAARTEDAYRSVLTRDRILARARRDGRGRHVS